MDDIRLLDDLEHLARRLALLPKRQQVAALEHVGRLLGGLDVVVLPRASRWHVDAVDALYAAGLSRLQAAAVCTDDATRRAVLHAAREAHEALGRQIRAMEINAELDALAARR